MSFHLECIYHRNSALISRYDVSLKIRLHGGLSESEFLTDMSVNQKGCRQNIFFEKKKKMLQHAFVRQTECMIATIILVANFAFLFNSTTISRSLD